MVGGERVGAELAPHRTAVRRIALAVDAKPLPSWPSDDHVTTKPPSLSAVTEEYRLWVAWRCTCWRGTLLPHRSCRPPHSAGRRCPSRCRPGRPTTTSPRSRRR